LYKVATYKLIKDLSAGDRDVVWKFDSSRKSPQSTGHPSNPNDAASPINPITSRNRSEETWFDLMSS